MFLQVVQKNIPKIWKKSLFYSKA